jgi:hypothetical protein
MIGMAVVLVGTSAVTFTYASDKGAMMPQQSFSQEFGQRDGFGQSDGNNPLEGFGSDNSQNGAQQNTPPSMNGSGQNGNTQQTPPSDNQQSSDNQNAPQAPPSDSQQSSDNQNAPQTPPSDNQKSDDSKTTENATPNEKDTATRNEDLNVTNTAKMMPQQRGSHGDVISVLCYLFGGLQIGIIVLILLYLAFSEFNKMSFNQTLSKFKK